MLTIEMVEMYIVLIYNIHVYHLNCDVLRWPYEIAFFFKLFQHHAYPRA